MAQFTANIDQAGHARTRFNQRVTAGRMFLPSLTHVVGRHDDSFRLAVVTAVDHDFAIGRLDDLGLGRIVESSGGNVPGITVVATKDETGVRQLSVEQERSSST